MTRDGYFGIISDLPNNIIILSNVPGQNIIFRNFRGRPTQYTKEGDRNFCLIIPGSLLRDQLASRGCNIKKLPGGTEFVNVSVRIAPGPEENADRIWTYLDVDHINKVDLELQFYEYNINGKKGTKIYLRNADFHIKDFDNDDVTIGIRYPNHVTCTIDNKNNTEETKMEKIMSVEEIITQFALLEYVYKNANSTDKKNLEDIMNAVRSAKYRLVSKMEDRCEIAENPNTKPTVTGYELEKAGDFAAIKQVIFNDPATVVVWWDDTKTVVKCQKGDTFDKEKGLAMAICKRLYGNESNFNNLIKKWTEPKVKKVEEKPENKPNKTHNGCRGKDVAPRKSKTSTELKSTSKMIVVTDEYIRCVRVKMAKRGWNYEQVANATGVCKSTINRYVSTKEIKSRPSRMRRDIFEKINKALGIRWRM